MFSEHTPTTLSRPRLFASMAFLAILGLGNLHCSDADEHPDPAPGAGRASVPPSGVNTPGPNGPSGGTNTTSPSDPVNGRGGSGGTGADGTGLSPTVGGNGNLGLAGAGIGTAGAAFGTAGASSADPNFGAFAGSSQFGRGDQGTGGFGL